MVLNLKNLFCIVGNKKNNTIEPEYKRYILRQVSKKQEEKIHSMSQSFQTTRQRLLPPKWIYALSRICTSLFLLSFIFLTVALISNEHNSFQEFLKKNLWLCIIFLISLVILVFSIILGQVYRKKMKQDKTQNKAEDIFDSILKLSKEYLGVPENAVSMEVLSYQVLKKDTEIHQPKHILYHNVVLNAFIEKDMLCFADLFDVIGIPLESIKKVEEVNETYSFKLWHKKEKPSFYQVRIGRFPIRHFEANSYFCIEVNINSEAFQILVPPYEAEPFNTLFKGRK